jgi:hypothetical protein
MMTMPLIAVAASVNVNPVSMLMVLGVVSSLFLLSLLVLWVMKRMGIQASADVDADMRGDVDAAIKRVGGRLRVSSNGSLGSFLAIALTALLCFCVIALVI